MYRILPLSKDIQQQIRDLRPADKNKLRDAFTDMEENPKWAAGNKIGPLKGDLAHLGWHYRLTRSTRIHYLIDEDNRSLLISYIGAHPNY